MASTSFDADIWGRLSYTLPNSIGILQNAAVKGTRYVIGRSFDCDLRIGLHMISAHHCYLSKESDGKIYLNDTSTNGTFVNDTRVTKKKRKEVSDGDKLYLVRKKSSPKSDFYLLFKTIANADNDDANSETEHRTKRLKVEPLTPVIVKSEPVDDVVEESVDVQDAVVTSPIMANVKIEAEFNTIEHDVTATLDNNSSVIIKAVKSEPTSSLEDHFVEPQASISGIGNDNIPEAIGIGNDNVSEASSSGIGNSIVPEASTSGVSSSSSTISDNTSRKQVNNENATVSCSSETGGIADMLKCSLCLEIFHDPVCLQPCLHSYCSGCYSEWMVCSNECPQCRLKVQLIAKNHMISSLTEAFLKSNPSRRRSSSDIELLEAKNKITQDHLKVPRSLQLDQASNSSQGSDNSQTFRNNSQRICRECPGNANAAIAQAGSSTANQPAPFLCRPNQNHVNCTCCFTLFPDRSDELDANPQSCELCQGTFCNMYWGCTEQGCSGCLNKFSKLKFSQKNWTSLLNNNLVETRILTDYAQSKGNTLQNITQECFQRLDANVYRLTVNLTSNSILCYTCGLSNLRTLVYKYRSEIPEKELPDSVTTRPNCYWGLNCRTQTHNVNHAQKYNHICNQTRF